MFENRIKTDLGALGEFGLINHIKKHVKIQNESTIKGIGDDAAVVRFNNKEVLISSDFYIENVNFDLTFHPLMHLGYKVVIAAISDIIAMNGVPSQILINIAVSNRFGLEAVEEFYNGINLACKRYKVDLIGGDTTTSSSGIVISTTAIGHANADKISYRSGAKEGDLICCSGDLGSAYLGFHILNREKTAFMENQETQPDLTGFDYLLERQLKPEARVDVIQLFEQLNIIPTSMMDISDGIASELNHIAKESKVGIKLYEEKLPIDHLTYQTALDMNLDPTICAINGGEDFELVFTVPQSDYDKIKGSLDISIIGYCTHESEGIHLVSKSNNIHPLKAQGFEMKVNPDD